MKSIIARTTTVSNPELSTKPPIPWTTATQNPKLSTKLQFPWRKENGSEQLLRTVLYQEINSKTISKDRQGVS
jgi:hypothetical protein